MEVPDIPIGYGRQKLIFRNETLITGLDKGCRSEQTQASKWLVWQLK
jgi:hypothetical protein